MINSIGWLSRETVKKLVHNTVAEMPKKECREKKKIRNLYIEVDENYVAARLYEKKGGLERGENGRKNNTLMPKLVLVYEESEESSRESHPLLDYPYNIEAMNG